MEWEEGVAIEERTEEEEEESYTVRNF